MGGTVDVLFARQRELVAAGDGLDDNVLVPDALLPEGRASAGEEGVDDGVVPAGVHDGDAEAGAVVGGGSGGEALDGVEHGDCGGEMEIEMEMRCAEFSQRTSTMRSLSPRRLAVTQLPSPPAPPAPPAPAAVAPDPESPALFVAAESPAPHGVRVDVLHLPPGRPPAPLASLTAPAAPFPAPAQTLALHYLPDDRALVLLLAGGDIATLALDGPDRAPVCLFCKFWLATLTCPARGRRQRRQRHQGCCLVARRRAARPRHGRRHARLHDQEFRCHPRRAAAIRRLWTGCVYSRTDKHTDKHTDIC